MPLPATRKSRAQEAYEMMASAVSDGTPLTWNQVAGRTGIRAKKGAKMWAKRNGFPWPLKREPMSADVKAQFFHKDSIGQRAYFLRQDTGLPWGSVAERLGTSQECAYTRAARFAFSRELPWPLPSQQESDDAELAPIIWSLRQTHTWKEISEEYSIGRERAQRLCTEWAKSVGLEPDPFKGKPQRAYEMKFLNPRMTWREVAARVGYKYGHHACGHAKEWAVPLGLIWPLVKRSV